MELFKLLSLKNGVKADKAAKFAESSFRLVLVILSVAGLIWPDFIETYQASLTYHALMTLAITYIPDLLRATTKIYIIPEFRFIYLVYVFVSQFLGEIADLYVTISWWDKMAHLISAFFITIIGYVVVYLMTDDKVTGRRVSLTFATIFAFSFSAMKGVLWEVFEYLMDVAFRLNMQKSGLVDTMEDFIVCVAGSLLACIIYIYETKKKRPAFVSRCINRFVETNKKTK